MLVSAYDGGIEGVFGPDQVALLIVLGLDRLQDALPGSVLLPALQAVVAGGTGRIAFGQILPGRSGAQDPENTVEHRAMIAPRVSALFGMRRRQERSDLLPLGIGQFVASHELRTSVKSIHL